MTLPISVVVVTKNEQRNIQECLAALSAFNDVWVIDSRSQDKTAELARSSGAQVVEFIWNGQYPKKRQYCLDHVPLKHDWVFFVDADEIVTDALVDEIKDIFSATPDHVGYFIKGCHTLDGKVLKHGLQNNKLALLDRRYIHFPVIDDLDIPGMGEIEGHYQPVLKDAASEATIGQLKAPVIHTAMEDARAWIFRHQKYARWEQGMNEKQAWPVDPKPFRQKMKLFLRSSRYRPHIIFFISYVVMLGFLDGKQGYEFARRKKTYYGLIG